MKSAKFFKARYLVLLTLGAANIVLFQNCSNYSGQVNLSDVEAMRSNKDLTVIAESSPALIQIGTEVTNQPSPNFPEEPPVMIQIDNPVVDTSTPMPGVDSESNTGHTSGETGTITTVTTTDGTITTIDPAPGSATIVNSPSPTDSNGPIPSTDDSGHIDDGHQNHHGENQTEQANTQNGEGQNGNISQNQTSNHQNNQNTDGENGPQIPVSPSPQLPSVGIVTTPGTPENSNSENRGLCRLLAAAGNKLLKIPVVTLGDDSQGKDVTIPEGKVLIISGSKSVLELNSLSVGGSTIICGDIKIRNFESHGNATLIFAQADQASINGTLATARLSPEGIQMTVDSKSGRSVKLCRVGSDLKIETLSANKRD